MKDKQKNTKKVMKDETIYRIMEWLPIGVSGIFFLKNVSEGNTTAMIAIGVCLAVFIGISIFVRVRKTSLYVREYSLAIALPVLVCAISLFSGASYSDDFSLYLAVMGMTGLYLEPKFTLTQFIEIDICLIIMYLVHPEKAESQSQYILCAVVFTLAAVLFYLVIKRGRAFIEISKVRAEESERLLESIRSMGADLQRDFADSSAKIEMSTQGLQNGSASIAKGAGEVSDSCNIVRDRIKETGEQIDELNKGVKQFENALSENKNNIMAMNEQVNSIGSIIGESNSVFKTMEEQMYEIADIAKQINDIAFKLTLLSLNASVEAAHSGESGAGFEVVASEMRALSESSGSFSNQVSDVVKEMRGRVSQISKQFAGSEEAFAQSEQTMRGLVESFERLNTQFEVLYGNIERQTQSVNQIDSIFDNLNQMVEDMHSSSLTNQDAVEDIVDAMSAYKDNVGKIVENTQSI